MRAGPRPRRAETPEGSPASKMPGRIGSTSNWVWCPRTCEDLDVRAFVMVLGEFDADGFLTLLVGMEAPTERPPRPGEVERAVFEELAQRAEGVASTALPMREALEALLGGAPYRA